MTSLSWRVSVSWELGIPSSPVISQLCLLRQSGPPTGPQIWLVYCLFAFSFHCILLIPLPLPPSLTELYFLFRFQVKIHSIHFQESGKIQPRVLFTAPIIIIFCLWTRLMFLVRLASSFFITIHLAPSYLGSKHSDDKGGQGIRVDYSSFHTFWSGDGMNNGPKWRRWFASLECNDVIASCSSKAAPYRIAWTWVPYTHVLVPPPSLFFANGIWFLLNGFFLQVQPR